MQPIQLTKKVNVTRVGVPISHLPIMEIAELKKRLTVMTVGYGGRKITRSAYYLAGYKLIGARMRTLQVLASMKKGYEAHSVIIKGEDFSTLTQIDPFEIKLDREQQIIFDYLLTNIFSTERQEMGMASGILDLAPGKGKTFVAMALMNHFKKKTLFIVPGIELLRQNLELLRKYFPSLKIGEYSGNKKQDGDIVVMTIHSVGHPPITYFDKFGLTIMDEVHEYCTKERSSVFWTTAANLTLGMSGTTNDRQDKMDPISHYWLGVPTNAEKVIADYYINNPHLKPGNDEPTQVWKTKFVCIRYNGPVEFTKSELSEQGTVCAPKMVNKFSWDPYRSQLLIDLVYDLVQKDPLNRIFVFVDRPLLAQLVRDYLNTELHDPNSVAVVVGKEKTPEARKSRVVIGTYACIGTGVSWPEFNCLICWHPRKNKHRQFLKRIFRNGGDYNLTRYAYFLQDNATTLKSQYRGFSSVCKELFPETKIIVDTVNYTEIEVSQEVKKIAENFKLVHSKLKDHIDDSSSEDDSDLDLSENL
jgi:superfamily II DNA or RNA helicase